MTMKPLPLTEELHTYLVAHGSPPDEIAQALTEETIALLPEDARMQVAPEQAALLTFLTRLVDARQAVEVGTFTGMSSLAIARGLPADGKLTCFDISDEFTSVARRYWDRAGVSDRIELRIGPAAESLRALPTEPYLDLAFIDADKIGYPVYWDELVPRMRPGGLIAVDNVLRGGRVLAPRDESDRAIAAFNDMARADERVDLVMLPVADGLTLGRRR
ncbi:class I SAM-dependent methyltransferase [Micromonospora polyrhachis]|uniref:Caffeoyl-CoA O-methyltransferase n=1 Tax=Micromonospora polyrhachis TaxID=1282883 RepID=A0A7W7SS63_9ACTN|nr:O-methyltransferase [Micromonospora polyrhachis]MBB4959968.1 caffeoyl-CoA O-methyltransferase [Micromonospora polyrhachis]